jgi:hypothetical protein
VPRASGAVVYVGQGFTSSVCSTNVVVLDPGSAREVPAYGGSATSPGVFIPCGEADRPGQGFVHTVVDLVYWDETTGMKLRCTRSGSGLLSVQGHETVALSRAARRWGRQGTAVLA